MCEYKVYLDGRLAYTDIVYVRKEGDTLVLRNALGAEARLKGYEIVLVDSFRERLELRRAGTSGGG